MRERVILEIKKHNLIKTNENIIIGLSGGADSMALLYILVELKLEIDFNIHIAHVNHGVRGEDALKDQEFVKGQARKLNLPYYTKNVDMIGYGKEKGITSEEAGRELRYGFFREILRNTGSGKIAVAHNKNDQAETLMMRFMRGTGVDGLKGMEYIVGDIIRPILGVSRRDIEKYINENNIETVSDMTNFQPIYNRNKVRLELIPYIEKNFNPNIIDTMWRLSEISSVDSDFLNEHAQDTYKNVVRKENDCRVILDAKKLLNLHPSMLQRVIRNSILNINKSLQGITEAQISNAIGLIEKSRTGKEIHLSNNIVVKTNYDEVIVQARIQKKEDDYFYVISYPGLVNLDKIGYSFDIDILSLEDYFNEKRDTYTRYFDLDKIQGNIAIRNRRPGDRFIPFGMSGTKKLKDYFIDEKISKDLRDKIPLIVDENYILWVIGYRTDERYKISDETRKILKISYRQTRIHN